VRDSIANVLAQDRRVAAASASPITAA
jgi:hypothetical protein